MLNAFNPLNLLGGKEDKHDLVNESSAAKRMKLLNGPEGIWIQARRNSWAYAFNKLASIAIGVAFAAITLSFKKTTQIYMI